MGKGTRKRLDRQEEKKRQEQVAAEQKQAARRKRRVWIVAAIVAAVAVLAVGVLLIVREVRRQDGSVLRSQTVMSTEHYTVDGAMMSYFIHAEARAYAAEHASTIAAEGLDTAQDLKAQPYTLGSSNADTWYDYFAAQATEKVKQYLRLAEGAHKAGITLSAEDDAYLDKQIQVVRDQAKSENKDEAAFVSETYGLGVNLDDVRRAIDLQMLGARYRQSMEQDQTYTDEELQDYYQDHSAKLSTCDYYTITFVSAIDDSFSDDQILDYNAATKRWADDLAACHDMDSFRAFLADYYRRYYEERGQDYDDAEIQAAINANATLVEAYTYTDDELGRWALDPARQAGDTTVIEGENEYSVYLITKAPTRLDYKTKNFRQILLSKVTDGTASGARDKANQLRDEFAAGEQTEAAFAKLAKQYNLYDTDKENGGLCENVRKDGTDEKVSEWLFADGRTPGETRIIKNSSDVYYLIYYIGEGETCWKTLATEYMQRASLDEAYDRLYGSVEIEVNENAIKGLPG